ncbi:MAG TPA: hypothetical protein ENJ31_03405 [Anaerolineae bacterium]|nr:hypothetical protein [Anaerolineae bacterium]
MALNRHCDLAARADRHIPLRRRGIPHSDVLRSLIGLLCPGKSDFDAVENMRKDRFFATAMGISKVPSGVTLRQRLDGGNDSLDNIDRVLDFNEAECRENPKAKGVDFIITWNPRREERAAGLNMPTSTPASPHLAPAGGWRCST